jgi:hypothetical protein
MNTPEVYMKRNEITVSSVLIAGGILAGFLFRWINLGLLPLDNMESIIAMQAFQVAQGIATHWSGHPLYLLLTTILFNFLGSSNFLARFIPACAGTALLFVPLLFRDKLKTSVLVILIWLLAIEPSLVVASRTAGSQMISMTLILFTLAMIFQCRVKTSAVLLGLTCLGGAPVWFGLIILAPAFAIWVLITKSDREIWRKYLDILTPAFWWTFVATIFIASTICLLIPVGVSTVVGSLVNFLSYWSADSSISIRLILLALPFYSPLILFAGIIGMIRSGKDETHVDLLFTLTALVGFLLILILPGRQSVMLIWVSVPLVFLAAEKIHDSLLVDGLDVKQTLLIAGFVVLILVFLWQVFGTLNQGTMEMNSFLLYMGAGVVILLVCAILAILGWSIRVTGIGYAWGFSLMLVLFTLMSAWRSTGLATDLRKEFWNGGIDPTQVQLLKQTVEEISGRTRGVPDGLDIVSLGIIQPALDWELRNQKIYKVDGLMPSESPALVITPITSQLALVEPYRGQDFTVISKMAWDAFTIQDWVKWIMIRRVPQTADIINILWVRGDLFPGYSSNTQPVQ